MSGIDNLLGLPGDILYRVILYSLPSVYLYQFSRVSNACLGAVREVAKLPQFEISLSARVALLKGKEEKEEIGTFAFTTIDDLCKTIKQIGIKTGIVFDEDKTLITLEEKDGEVSFEEQNQTVSALLFQRLKTETLLRHRALINALPENTPPAILQHFRFPTDRTFEALSYSFGHDSPYLAACYPLMILFDFHTKSFSEQKLGRATLIATTEIAHVPELSYNIVNAIFCHPHAKDIPLGSLTTALIKSIGEKYEVKMSCNLSRIGGLNRKTKGKLHTLDYHVVPPEEMLKDRETKNLKVPRLIFSHPKVPNMTIKDQIENMLLSAVRYRAFDLVQKILAHEDASHISDDALVIARDEAKSAGEEAIANTIETFLEALGPGENDLICTLV